ncbi:MAG: hypothetical protein B9S34_10055 [Opitutia bacterium Tous-C1TDCM]|nr:MAG: hypothetical protein B9S34_10055 [Opitutae bacterium Tous-C1TDCM]
MRPVGTRWLIEHFKPAPVVVSHFSGIGGKRTCETRTDGTVEEVFPRSYWPGDEPLDHVRFALRYEPLSLDLLHQVFRNLSDRDIEKYISAEPSGKYSRRIGFLYEFLCAREVSAAVTGNFIPVLDDSRYFVGPERLNHRWRVRDNLLGAAGFCPSVRKTPAVVKKLQVDHSGEIRRLARQAGPDLLARAINYLYAKETKASFDIERATIGGSKMQRFLRVLAEVGLTDGQNLLDEQRLVLLQNLIVDSRYANLAFRTDQNYIGRTLPNLQEQIHYVCPPPALIKTLMAGLRTFLLRSEGLPAPLRAAVVSFGFVYIHPFDDGNGRLHRLLLHETLARDGYTDAGMVLPLSAGMARDPVGYDKVIEGFSRTVLGRVQYEVDSKGCMTIGNVREAEGVWRYPDLTAHVEYILDLIATTVRDDLPSELDIIQRFDTAGRAIAEVVDLPSRRMQLMLKLLHQNQGKLSKTKLNQEFPELAEREIQAVEAAFRAAFQDAQRS